MQAVEEMIRLLHPCLFRTVDHEGELITAVSCKDIPFRNKLPEFICQGNQQLIADMVSVQVIEQLEVIDIDLNQDQLCMFIQELLCILIQTSAVHDMGQGIFPGIMKQHLIICCQAFIVGLQCVVVLLQFIKVRLQIMVAHAKFVIVCLQGMVVCLQVLAVLDQ